MHYGTTVLYCVVYFIFIFPLPMKSGSTVVPILYIVGLFESTISLSLL